MVWAEVMELRNLKSAGSLRFIHHDQLIQAAVAGQGVALGISPLVRRHIGQGQLVAPFTQRFASPRAYYLITSPRAQGRQEVRDFVAWLLGAAQLDGETHGSQ